MANSGSDTVSVINGSTRGDEFNRSEVEIPGIKVDDRPIDIAVNPKTNMVYVANSGSDTVSVIDGANNKVVSNIPTGKSPSAIAVNPKTNRIYTANSGNATVTVIDGSREKGLGNITVGSVLPSIGVASDTNKIYVVKPGNITEINGKTNKIAANISLTKLPFPLRGIDPVITSDSRGKDTIYAVSSNFDNGTFYAISVENSYKSGTTSYIGHEISLRQSLSEIAVNPDTNLAYVTNGGNDTVSVIDPYIYKVVDNVTVGKDPSAIIANPRTAMVYVADSGNDTVSVINGLHDKVVSNVKVEKSPTAVAVNPNTDMIYVANRDSNTVSVIDGSINKVVAGVTFRISPPSSGHIKCNNKEFATNQYLRIVAGTQCKPETNKGFQFSTWIENLGHNSSKAMTTSTISNSPFDSLLTALGFNLSDESAIFNVTHNGNFTANFEKVPPPIPPEYWIPLYGVIVSSIVGWSIPSIIGWIKAKRQRARLGRYKRRIDSLYNDGKSNQSDVEDLDNLKSDIADAYAKGKISDQHYGDLKNDISIQYEEFYKKRIDSLNGGKLDQNSNDYAILLDKIKNDIIDAYAKGKINELHYTLLANKIKL